MKKTNTVLLLIIAMTFLSTGKVNDDITFSDWDKNDDTFIPDQNLFTDLNKIM